MENKYIIKNKYREEIVTLLSTTEMADLISKSVNENWERKKINVYVSRRKFPEPSFLIGNIPYWSLKRIEEFIESRKEVAGKKV